MEHERVGVTGYFSRLVGGLVVCAVVAVTLHAEVAAGAILATVMLLALVASFALLRGAH